MQAERAWELLAMIQDGENDFPRLLNAAQDIFEASGASLFLERETKGVFELAAATGLSVSIPLDTVVRESEGLAGHSIREKKPLLVGNPNEVDGGAHSDFKQRREIGSSLVVPLILPTHVPVGVINFARSADHEEFNESDLQRAASIASSLALIFENARLVSNLKKSHIMLSQVLQSFDIGVCLFDGGQNLLAYNDPAKAWLTSQPDRWSTFLRSLPQDLAILAQIGSHAVMDPGSDSREFWKGECEYDQKYLRVQIVGLVGGGVAWTVQNLTDHVHAQREAARLQRLAEIGQMTAAVAHEIRNPLTSISGAARMIQELPDRSIEFATVIEEESLKLSELCHEFLDFSKPLRLKRQDVNLKALLVRLKEMHTRDAEDRSVDIVVSGDEHLPTFHIDPLRIEQVARNLLLNAIQACPPGGRVEMSADEKGFRVLDNGVGISNEFMQRLFTPFSTSKVDGTGLGLCNVKKIVDAHGGFISVDQLTPGTCFKVQFPERAA